MRRVLQLFVGILVVALLGACSIPPEAEPRPLPTGATPSPAPTANTPSVPSEGQVTLWFVRSGRLVPTPRLTTGPVDPQGMIDLLVAGPTDDEKEAGIRTAVVSVVNGLPLVVTAETAGVDVRDVDDDEVAIVLEAEFKDLLAEEQVLVLGEVVTTVAVAPIEKVLFVDDDGQLLGVPVADGRLRNGAVTPADYAALIE